MTLMVRGYFPKNCRTEIDSSLPAFALFLTEACLGASGMRLTATMASTEPKTTYMGRVLRPKAPQRRPKMLEPTA